MRRQIAAALGLVVLVATTSSSPAIAQEGPAKAGASHYQPDGESGPATPPFLIADSSNAAKGGKTYVSIKDLMESIIDPSADTLWGAVGTVVDKDGIHESFPKAPEEWLDVRHAAVRIIEGGNLLTMPGREAAPVGTKSEAPGVELEPDEIAALIRSERTSFDAFAMALQAVGLEALRAIDAKDPALLMDVGARMEGVCESCHQTFWYPQEKRSRR
jgi:hypothetical protein